MSKRNRKPKQGHLGPAFHEWLEYLEYVESVAVLEKQPAKQKHMAMNDTLFHVESDEAFTRMMMDAMPVDAYLARVVRSSVKYKVDAETFAGLVHCYEPELKHIRNTVPMYLPHEWCTVIVEWGGDTYLISLQETETNTGDAYPELGVPEGEKWICANMCLHRQTGVELMQDGEIHPEARLSYVPVELHFERGKLWNDTNHVTAVATGVEATEKGKQAIDIFRAFIMIWLEQFQLQSVLRHKQVSGGRPPATFRPAKWRKKHEHPQFEHTVIQMEMDAPDPSQTGRSIFQPRKRLHQVRGFWRQYKKTGKRVWVKPHWRGDEHLGVVRRDVELVTHDESVDEEPQKPHKRPRRQLLNTVAVPAAPRIHAHTERQSGE